MATKWHGLTWFPDKVTWVAWKRINRMHQEQHRKKKYRRNWYPYVALDTLHPKVTKAMRLLGPLLARHRSIEIPEFGTIKVVREKRRRAAYWNWMLGKRGHITKRYTRRYVVVFEPDPLLVEYLNTEL